jgi:hypothetical protein
MRLGYSDGTVEVDGGFDGKKTQFSLKAETVRLGQLAQVLGPGTLAGLSGELVLESAQAVASASGVNVSTFTARLAQDAQVSGSLVLGPPAGGLTLIGAKLKVNTTALLFAQLTRALNPEAAQGNLSLEATASPTSFTARIRSGDFEVGVEPKVHFDGISAAVNGVLATIGGRRAVGWSANVRASRFKVNWPTLFAGLGLPVARPLALTSGSALVVSDLQGLHIKDLKVAGTLASGSGQLDVSPDGQLSGRLFVKLAATATVASAETTRILTGTLVKPEFVTP